MGTGDKVDKPAGRGAMCRERAQEGMDTQQRGKAGRRTLGDEGLMDET